MELHQRIVTARKSKGLTQEELASLTNLTTRTIQRIENGENIPRSFTLKAIALAVDKPFEFFTAENPYNPVETQGKEIRFLQHDTIHFLQLFNLSCFFYIGVPWVHFLIPRSILKKRTGLSLEAINFGRKVIRQQVYWVIALHLVMLLTLAYNLAQVSFFHNRNNLISYVWPFLVMYFLNAIIILANAYRIKRSGFLSQLSLIS